MRMIGIGLVGFLIAGVALLLSTMNLLEKGQRFVREATSGPQLVFEHRTPATAPDTDRTVILRTNPDHPVILSGLPAYQSIAFIMPVDARPTSGYLQIDATSQVLSGVEGVLRISIRNTRRGEMLLTSGEGARSLQIPLSPTDFAGDQLVVSFSLQGTGPHRQCGPQDGIAAIVEIETSSAVHLTLDRPQHSVRDQIHAWGKVVRIAWPDWLKQQEQLRRLVLSTEYQRRGLASSFVASPTEFDLTTADLRAGLDAFPLERPDANGAVHLAQTGANAGLRRFHRQVEWRDVFELGAAAEQNLPTQLDLQLLFGRLIGDQHWALTVTLNKRLIFQDQINGAQTAFRRSIDLPTDILAATNIIQVVATVAIEQDGVCDQGPELIAEMLPSSHLVAGDTPFFDPLSEVYAALRDVERVNIALTSALNAVDANTASRMLEQVIPADMAFKPAGKLAHVTVLAVGHPTPALPETGPIWLVTNDATAQGLSITKLQSGDVLPRTGVALLITPSAVATAEMAG